MKPKKDSTRSLSGNHIKEPSLLERTGWQVREVGRDPTRYLERQAPNDSKRKANRD